MRFALAMVASLLPRHYWRQLETVLPVSRAAIPSSIASVLLAAALAVPAYLQYTEANAVAAVDTMLKATGWREAPPGAAMPSSDEALVRWYSGYLSPVEFFFLTPLGLLTLYLAATGWFRVATAYVDDHERDMVPPWHTRRAPDARRPPHPISADGDYGPRSSAAGDSLRIAADDAVSRS